MNKKERTPTEQVKHRKTIKNLLFGGEIFSVIAPYIAVGIANYDEYFIQYDGTKTSIAFVLAMAVMGIMITLIVTKKLKGDIITILLGAIVADIIFWLLGSLINDIAYILLYGIIGLVFALICDKQRESQEQEINKLISGINKAKEDIVAEEYKQELKENIKIKIKK